MDYNHTEQPNMNFQQPNFNPYKRQPNKMATLSARARRADPSFCDQHLLLSILPRPWAEVLSMGPKRLVLTLAIRN